MMSRIRVGAVAALLAVPVVAEAQEMAQPPSGPVLPNVPAPPGPPAAVLPGNPPANPAEPTNPYTRGLEAESLPAEIEEDLATGRVAPRFGPDAGLRRQLPDGLPAVRRLVRRYRHPDVRLGRGRLHGRLVRHGPALRPAPAEPVRQRVLAQPDRLGAPEAAQAGRVQPRLQRSGISPAPTRPWAQPKGGIGCTITSNPHFSQDFRDLYLSAHLPILTERRHGLQDRPHEHDHRLQRLPRPLPAVLLQRLPVLLLRRTVPSPAS